MRHAPLLSLQSRRLVTDKVTQGLTIIVEMLIIAAIIYRKYYS